VLVQKQTPQSVREAKIKLNQAAKLVGFLNGIPGKEEPVDGGVIEDVGKCIDHLRDLRNLPHQKEILESETKIKAVILRLRDLRYRVFQDILVVLRWFSLRLWVQLLCQSVLLIAPPPVYDGAAPGLGFCVCGCAKKCIK
jgi:hypothetical protein